MNLNQAFIRGFLKRAADQPINWPNLQKAFMGVEGGGGGIRSTTFNDMTNRHPDLFTAQQMNYGTNFPPKTLWPSPIAKNKDLHFSNITNIAKGMLEDMRLPQTESSIPALTRRYRGLNEPGYLDRFKRIYNQINPFKAVSRHQFNKL